jgi:hypothetical protein
MKNATLETHIKNGNIAPSYLLIDRDILKLQQIANEFAKNFQLADIFRLSGNPNILVKETEEFISLAHLAPVGDKKLLIICDASTMTPQAQNKTLKTIEDTPANTVFMLLASSAGAILNTIKSRCVTIYPDPVSPSLTDTALLASNPQSQKILDAVQTILTQCKTLDDALPHLPLITKRENIQITLYAFNHHANKLTPGKRHAILTKLSIINRNISAGCNAVNILDTLLMELYKRDE